MGLREQEEIQKRCAMMGDYMAYDEDGNKEFIGVENEDPVLTEEDYTQEELWGKGTAMLTVPKGPEEDETRQPQPDEPEEYWKFAKCWDCKFYNKKLYACLFHDVYVPQNYNCSHFEVLKDSNPEKYEAIIAEKIIKDSQILLYYALNKRHEKYYKQLADNIIMFQATMDNFIKRLKEQVK